VLYTDRYELIKNISKGGGMNDSFSDHVKQKTKLFSLKRKVAIVIELNKNIK